MGSAAAVAPHLLLIHPREPAAACCRPFLHSVVPSAVAAGSRGSTRRASRSDITLGYSRRACFPLTLCAQGWRPGRPVPAAPLLDLLASLQRALPTAQREDRVPERAK